MKDIFKQGGLYLFAGISAAILELLLFSILHMGVGFNIAASNMIAVAIATVYNFIVNSNVTFKGASHPVRSVALYIMLFFVNLGISTAAISAMADAGFNPAIAKAVMQVCIAAWNFVLYKRVVFR